MQKSKFLALLLAVAMIAAMIVVPASAAAPTTCKRCGQVAEWTEWKGTKFEAAGHYYLTEDVTLAERVAPNLEVCLDLRGHTITGPNAGKDADTGEVFRIYGGATVTLMDSVGGGKIKAVGEYKAQEKGGTIYLAGNCKLYCYNIEITGGKINFADKADKGGNIYGDGGNEVYMENCKVTNGSCGDVDSKDDVGGNLWVKGNVTLVNCTITGGTAGRAGNVHVEGSKDKPATLIIKDSTIVNGTVGTTDGAGTSSVRAGGFCNIIITGDTEIDALSLAAGSKLSMFSGEVGTVNVRHGDQSLHNIYGGTIEQLCGNNHNYVTIHNAKIMDLKTSDIGEGDLYGQATIASCATKVSLGTSGILVAHPEGACSTCGHTYGASACSTCTYAHASLAGDIKLPWDGTSNIESGKYALDKNVTVSGEVAIKGNLDLNGFTLTVEGKLDASAGNITDSIGGGKLVGTDKVTLNAANEALPLTAGDKAVSFETVTLKQGYLGKKYAAGADTTSYAFYVNKTASKTKVDEAIAAGTVKLEVYVKYNNGTADAEQVFELTADQITAYTASANWNGKMLCLNLTDLANVTVLEINARLVANGVTID